MSEPNQRSIKSFFGGPKRPRTQESATDNVENRSSKSTRISSPISIDSESDNSESDSNDLYGISELISSLKDLSSHSITTTENKKVSNKIFPWKDGYLDMFP